MRLFIFLVVEHVSRAIDCTDDESVGEIMSLSQWEEREVNRERSGSGATECNPSAITPSASSFAVSLFRIWKCRSWRRHQSRESRGKRDCRFPALPQREARVPNGALTATRRHHNRSGTL
jgi:hypothetical protein